MWFVKKNANRTVENCPQNWEKYMHIECIHDMLYAMYDIRCVDDFLSPFLVRTSYLCKSWKRPQRQAGKQPKCIWAKAPRQSNPPAKPNPMATRRRRRWRWNPLAKAKAYWIILVWFLDLVWFFCELVICLARFSFFARFNHLVTWFSTLWRIKCLYRGREKRKTKHFEK